MKFDFYYGDESEQYSFYSVPKMFFTNDVFNGLSAMSKLLYSFLLDRMSLSRKRNWIDDKNRAYIKYSLKSICKDMNVSRNSAIKYMRELQEFGLITKYPKEGMEDIVYVMDFSKVKQIRYDEQRNINISDTDKETEANNKIEAASDTDTYDTYAPPDFNKVEQDENIKNDDLGCKGKHTQSTGAKIEPVQNLNWFKNCTGSKSEPV